MKVKAVGTRQAFLEVNLILKQLNGKLNLPALLKFLYLKKKRP